MLIIDADLDLAWNALQWNRDLQSSVHTIRSRESALTGAGRGQGTVALPEMRAGRIRSLFCDAAGALHIERETKLGGPLHSKGVLILSGFLAAQYVTDQPLSLRASLVLEQSYGGIEGDSASSGELYALLSALADVPVRQCFAVTGSVNQHGEIQAIGGVNQKIEGFFDVASARGLDGTQGGLIPSSNVKHLMLRRDVIEAVRDGRFHIYPVRTVDEGLAILTGLPAGERDADGHYPEGSLNHRISARLVEFAERRRAFGGRGQTEARQDK